MKVSDIYIKYTDILKKNNISTPEMECKIFISYLLNININELFFYLDDIFYKEKSLNNLINERIKGKPIYKIIGKKPFWNYDFLTNVDVLDPRSDSETMIRAVLEDFDIDDDIKILDLGTGSGCLILTLLKLFKNAIGVAVDINEKSLDIARKNAELLNIKNITFINSNWNDKICGNFDIIISNPPYIKTGDIDNLDIEVKKYDPLIALDGGADGLDCYKYIAKNIAKNCNKKTMLYLEIGFDQKKDVVDIFSDNGFLFNGSKKDFSNKDRVVKFRSNNFNIF